MTTDLVAKVARFRALHERPDPLLLPNPWDAGTARLLASLGFEALATTSLGVANAAGRTFATRQEILDNCRVINEATVLPVNADLENGFAHEPAEAARMIEDAAHAGAAGASIEDYSGESHSPIYDFALSVERIRAAAETAHALPAPLLLTARAENLLHGVDDLDDTIKRLQAYENAGADVLYAPGLRTLDEMRAVVSSVRKPVNIVMGFADPSITLEQLGEIGVRRVSIGGALSRLALKSFMAGAKQMRAGRFGFVAELPPTAELHEAFGDQ
ncbi:2-Methylisocitrate lyase, PEP mutase family [Amycolatopsis marina]|uniref:2-Methylisocitrate lyase, PEP mutase family n=1 Tax=Amycolatopsis marina TaxID=490629 RepID=A0A1I1BH98_9PSEU|nr:isocitrate lyase/phosphoenolpyruvate mutase family protein [Amycolatopsis marina]SFB49755.1 2-Methylisocitrate lyase, PEP mutase family [Amycolatopsis marina]